MPSVRRESTKPIPVLAMFVSSVVVMLAAVVVATLTDAAKDILPGVFGLVGALIGAATAALSIERQLQREALLQEEENLRRARIAARILQADLAQADARYRKAIAVKKYWRADFGMPVEAWRKYREEMAWRLSVDSWKSVNAAFRSLATSERQATVERRSSGQERPPLKAFGKKQSEIARRRIIRAISLLEPLAEDSPRELADTEEEE